MGRHYTPIGRVVPVEPETNIPPPEQFFYETSIQVTPEFIDKSLPGRRQLESILVLEHITIVTLLPILAFLVEESLEQREIRHIRQQFLESLSVQ